MAATCLVLLGLAPGSPASASPEPAALAGGLTPGALEFGPEADHHHPAAGHGGGEHCLSGPGCTSVAVLPDAAALSIGKPGPTLIRADLSPPHRDPLPQLHPPNPAVQS